MKKIKFRLIKDGKTVGYEKWYQGKRYGPDSAMAGYVAAPCWLYSKDNKYWTKNYLFHDNKDQFTGLKDKNGKGKEIYASDILSPYDGFIKYFAYWDTEQGQWWGRCIQTKTTKAYPQTLPLYEILDKWHMEIIGTIHDEVTEA